MEILMKLKCSPSASANRSPHSTLKVVDHHHQLQQQHVGHASHMSTPSPSAIHAAPTVPVTLQPSAHSNSSPAEILLPTCLEYTTTMDFCGATQQQEIVDLQWEQPNTLSNGIGRGRSMHILNRDICTGYTPPLSSTSHSMIANMPQSNTMNVPSCCSSYEPACCSRGLSYGRNFFTPPPTTSIQQHHLQEGTLNMLNYSDDGNTFDYHEPDENFISIDDAKIKGFLMKIGEKEQAKRNPPPVKTNMDQSKNMESVVYEIIELEDEEAIGDLVGHKSNNTSTAKPLSTSAVSINDGLPNTKSDIEKQTAASQEKIVASIDLLDSTDSEQEEDLPLTAVTCELQYDEDDNDAQVEAINSMENDDVVLQFDDEENVEFIDEQEVGVEVRWDDLEEQRERTFFECYLCGKKVQSSYNLRRHMMIHTGERPFGCDMCERRFREFSDLKKHRRRHINEPNFVCMICRLNTPTEHDPTRCLACDSKNGAALAAMRPQVSSSPEKSRTPPVILKNAKKVPTPQPQRSSTPIAHISLSSPPTPTKSDSPALPPLAPLGGKSSAVSDTQLLLDNVSAVHRPTFNQIGVLTRKEFPCPLCQRPFGTRHNLKRHFMIHTGEKPFNCPRCRKPFREYSTLKKHLVTHQRDRWYKCHLCPHKYRDYIKYNDHKRTHSRFESAESPLQKMTKPKHALHDDSLDSNDEDSSTDDCLECCECGQRFTDIEAYTEHLKEHDPTIFLYECYICKKTFSEREELEKHVPTHDEVEKLAPEDNAYNENQ